MNPEPDAIIAKYILNFIHLPQRMSILLTADVSCICPTSKRRPSNSPTAVIIDGRNAYSAEKGTLIPWVDIKTHMVECHKSRPALCIRCPTRGDIRARRSL